MSPLTLRFAFPVTRRCRQRGEVSGTTLFSPDREQGSGCAEPSREPSKESPVSEHVSGTQEAGHEVDRLHTGPRIRLRVSQPRITLRLQLPATRQAEMKNIGGGKTKIEKGTRRGREGMAARARGQRRERNERYRRFESYGEWIAADYSLHACPFVIGMEVYLV